MKALFNKQCLLLRSILFRFALGDLYAWVGFESNQTFHVRMKKELIYIKFEFYLLFSLELDLIKVTWLHWKQQFDISNII